MNTSKLLFSAYAEARTRLELQVDKISSDDLLLKLNPSPNSIGFILQHIADVEMLFAKNVFKSSVVHFVAKTVIEKVDTGMWTDMTELKMALNLSKETILKAITEQNPDQWHEEVHTEEFGTKSKTEAFGRIVSHTAYHAGQLALIRKYGA
jgi:uncharacterized damage-inducible protein DinB